MNTARQSDTAHAEKIMQICLGYMPSICLNIAATLGVADQLAAGPRNAGSIAAAVGANEDALYRMMRALSTVGVFEEQDGRNFAQTPLSDLLRTDHPQSLRPIARFISDPLHFRCYANLMHSIKTGETTAEPTVGGPLFEYLQTDPEESESFNAAMVNMTRVFMPPILEAYDFSGIGTLVDVGGGHGSVLASILQKYPQMRGILYDLGHVVSGSGPLLTAMGVAERCQAIAGNFFESVPRGGDAYIMKHIIHDWDDQRCLQILGNIRQALSGHSAGRVLLLEIVIAGRNEPDFGKWADIEMLALPGGRERTEAEFTQLFNNAGFRLARVVRTESALSVIEAVPRD